MTDYRLFIRAFTDAKIRFAAGKGGDLCCINTYDKDSNVQTVYWFDDHGKLDSIDVIREN